MSPVNNTLLAHGPIPLRFSSVDVRKGPGGRIARRERLLRRLIDEVRCRVEIDPPPAPARVPRCADGRNGDRDSWAGREYRLALRAQDIRRILRAHGSLLLSTPVQGATPSGMV